MIKLFKYIFPLVLLAVYSNKLTAQKGAYDTLRVEAFITPEGDTIPSAWLPTVEVKSIMTAQAKKQWQEWTRLRNAVYVTYPYALRASMVINVVNSQLRNVTDEKKRKEIIKLREKDLKRDFGDKVTNLSIYQGKVLMKLIKRETGNNCYDLIKEYKGGFNAGFWQTVAYLFSSSLKQQYDPKGEDQQIEQFVLEVRKLYGLRS
jgi:Domain of unknown function (DUF4294)